MGETNYWRVIEGIGAFVIVEAVGWYATGNPTTALALAIPAGALIYRQGISLDTLNTLVGDVEEIINPTTPASGLLLSVNSEDVTIGQAVTFGVTGAKGAWTLYYGTTANPVPISQAQTGISLDYALTYTSPLGTALEAFSGSLPVFIKDASGNVSNVITLTLS